MTSPTQWTWIEANSGRQWRIEEPALLLSILGVAKNQIQLVDWTTTSISIGNKFLMYFPEIKKCLKWSSGIYFCKLFLKLLWFFSADGSQMHVSCQIFTRVPGSCAQLVLGCSQLASEKKSKEYTPKGGERERADATWVSRGSAQGRRWWEENRNSRQFVGTSWEYMGWPETSNMARKKKYGGVSYLERF